MQAGADSWRDVLDVNLTGVFHTVEIAIPTMVQQQRGGSIVLTSSTAGLSGFGNANAGSIGYVASKHGVVGLMRIYANLLARHNIRVNTVLPAGVDTPLINSDFIRKYLAEAADQPHAHLDISNALQASLSSAEPPGLA
jgi:NAD(P)-dependent dehydrogenase (short-subunit alcohol dehydrogenase family)